MLKLLWIGLGGFAGAIARYALSDWVYRLAGSGFPAGTLAVNVLGCALLGFGAAWAEERVWLSPETRALWFVGVLGAFTTFSTFGYETFQLVREGSLLSAGLNALASLALGLLAVWGGHILAKVI